MDLNQFKAGAREQQRNSICWHATYILQGFWSYQIRVDEKSGKAGMDTATSSILLYDPGK